MKNSTTDLIGLIVCVIFVLFFIVAAMIVGVNIFSKCVKQKDIIKIDCPEKQYQAVVVQTTGYCNAYICTNKTPFDLDYGKTAIMTVARKGVCAADWTVFPVGSVLDIPDYGLCIVEDKGGAIKGFELDLFFDTYQEAKEWGSKTHQVTYIGRFL